MRPEAEGAEGARATATGEAASLAQPDREARAFVAWRNSASIIECTPALRMFVSYVYLSFSCSRRIKRRRCRLGMQGAGAAVGGQPDQDATAGQHQPVDAVTPCCPRFSFCRAAAHSRVAVENRLSANRRRFTAKAVLTSTERMFLRYPWSRSTGRMSFG